LDAQSVPNADQIPATLCVMRLPLTFSLADCSFDRRDHSRMRPAPALGCYVMSIDGHRVVGILGGMGPEATVDLMRRVIAATPARDDIDHIHLLVDSNPKVPSRIAALIEGTGSDPAPAIIEMAKRLEVGGADVLAVACNTAHAYVDQVRSATSIPLLDMIDLTTRRISRMTLKHKNVGLLASSAVVKLGLYHHGLSAHGIALVTPANQDQLMDIIKAVKRGDSGLRNREHFARIARDLMRESVDMLLIACTELSMLADSFDGGFPMLDALEILAREIVTFGLGGVGADSRGAAAILRS
jgi:aspartate racemase